MNAKMFGWIFLILFLLLTGLAVVTNFKIVWMGTIAGISALVSAIAFAFAYKTL